MSMPNPTRIVRALAGVTAILILGLSVGAATAQVEMSGPEIGEGADNSQPVFVMPRSGPFTPETVAIPNARIIAAWSGSGHADSSAEAFRHWDDEGEIDPACSVCHSSIGFRSFHGLDGSEPGVPESPVPVGGVVDCETCHNPNLGTVTEITLASGVVHPVQGVEAACVTCHGGREAGIDVAAATEGLPDDEPSGDLRFLNPHYFLGAAMNLGSYGGLGYEYPGKTYSGRFLHARPVATCNSCHDPHTLKISEQTCLTCHFTGDPEDIRIARVSFDGSGDTTKGIHDDIVANGDRLLAMMKDYAAEVVGTPMVYNGDRYPYFFADANGDGVGDEAEGRAVAYNAWTPRLLKATFNWKAVSADPGAFAHNAPYALELLYDSMEDLAGPLGVDMDELDLIR
ncbi:MAG: cytochrome C [Maritimibacter sp.]|nr:cytochrome C [Maritimibacter sp.]